MYGNPSEDAIPFRLPSSLTEIPQDHLKESNLDKEEKEESNESLYYFPDESKTILVFEPPTIERVLEEIYQPQPQLLAPTNRICILENNKKSPGPQSKDSKAALGKFIKDNNLAHYNKRVKFNYSHWNTYEHARGVRALDLLQDNPKWFWEAVAVYVGSRSKQQCKSHFQKQGERELNKDIKKRVQPEGGHRDRDRDQYLGGVKIPKVAAPRIIGEERAGRTNGKRDDVLGLAVDAMGDLYHANMRHSPQGFLQVLQYINDY